MPRYFFNLHDDAEYPDFQGTELDELDDARDEAVRFATTLLRNKPELFWNSKFWSMEVCDDAGLVLFSLTFSASEMPSVGGVPYRPEP